MALNPIDNIINQYAESVTSTIEFYTSHLNNLVGPPVQLYDSHLNRLVNHAGELLPSILIGANAGFVIPLGRPYITAPDRIIRFTTNLFLTGLYLRLMSDSIENYSANKPFLQATKNIGAGTLSTFLGGAISLFGGMFIDAYLMMSGTRVSIKLISAYMVGSILSSTSLDLYFRTEWNLTT